MAKIALACAVGGASLKPQQNTNNEADLESLYSIAQHYTVTTQCKSRYSDSLQAGRSGDRIPVGARFSAPIQTGHGAHPASYTIGTGSFPGVEGGGVTLTTHRL
jgi:hypothetical protein